MPERQTLILSVVGAALLIVLFFEASYYLSTYHALSGFKVSLQSITVQIDDCDSVRVSFGLNLRNDGPIEIVVTRIDIDSLFLDGQRLIYYSPHILTIGVRTKVPPSTETILTFDTEVQPSRDLDTILATMASGDDSWEVALRIHHSADFNNAIHAAALQWQRADVEGLQPSECIQP